MDTNTQFKKGDKVYFPMYDDLFFRGIGTVVDDRNNSITVSFGKISGQIYNIIVFTREGWYNKNIRKKVLFKTEREYVEHKDTFEFPRVEVNGQYDRPFEILLQLIGIRDFFNCGWQPNWKSDAERKYYIRCCKGEIDSKSNLGFTENRLFSFYTSELCDLFIERYRPYLEEVKQFI